MLKRTLDILVAAVLLLALLPLFLAVAALVRARLGSPIFFTQTRIGRDEKPFQLIKFRTMTDARAADGSLRDDAHRLTPFGHWLRASSIDELPELWNILTGDMSLVGPRPLLPHYLPCYTPRERLRHRVRPGITGLAQVNGRNAISWDARLELDAQYVDHFSFVRDLAILWQTIAVVWKRQGISAEGQPTMHALDVERAHKGTP
ncbi:MAG: sugar transferase [Alphaproteobacteria bacterium]|nr:sugar transferase [Alphaproteobacteria bacterium]